MPFATINGARLWHDELGVGAPVLLHHGYTASRDNWMPVAVHLAKHCRVLLMECRGAGASEHTANGYTLAQYTADVIGMLDHLGLQRVTFAGHSMGGGIGYLLGLEHPERLNALVLMAPIPADGTAAITPELRAQRIAERRRGDRVAILARYTSARFRPDVLTPAWFESRADHVLGVSDGHFEGSADSMQAFDVSARLGALTTPTLMLAGMADSLLHANLRDFAALPNAVLEVYARASHEVGVCEPQRVAAAIAHFMVEGVVTADTLLQRQPQ